MAIKFLCPNGHTLSAPENRAGKPGKCPKCQTDFMVPSLEELGLEAGAGSSSGKSRQSEPAEGSASRSGMRGAYSASELFVFLCPNGHKLNGPPSLKGKAGQCPHCGARFHIPTDDDLEEPPQEEEIPTGEAVEEIEAAPEPEEIVNVPLADVEIDVDPPPAGVHALGYIMGRLWERKDDQVELEIYLNEGEIVAPEFYCENLSTQDYGVFAMQGDGAYSVTVIPWSAVRRIGLRRLQFLPQPMFR